MARSLKFRAWDKQNAEMVPFESIYIELEDGCMSVYKFVKNGNGLPDRHELDTYEGNVVLMQHTGLKDKNGVEIYEGDIVKVDDDWDNYGFAAGVIGPVIFTNSAKYAIRNSHGGAITFEKDSHAYTEVIGNVYQNPELLAGDAE